MTKINEIEVNGQKYGIEAEHDIYVGYEEPTGENKPMIWMQPSGVRMLYEQNLYEGTSINGNYTLDENGTLVSTSDTSSATGSRCTELIPVFNENKYKVIRCTSTTVEDAYNRNVGIYCYDINKQFINASTTVIPAATTYTAGTPFIEAELPENVKYIRVLVPYHFVQRYTALANDKARLKTIVNYNYGYTTYDTDTHSYCYDGDHYVQL